MKFRDSPPVAITPRIWWPLTLAGMLFLWPLPMTANPHTAELSDRSKGSQWLLEQEQPDIGKLSVYVSYDAIKIVSSERGFQLVTKAPTWTVHCFRPVDKTEWVGELNQFSGCMLNNPFGVAGKSNDHLSAFETGTFNGVKYIRYGLTKNSRSVIYGAADIPISPRASEFFNRLYGAGDIGKVPLYRCKDRGLDTPLPKPSKDAWLNMDYANDLRGGMVVIFTTKSSKKLPFNAADYEYPQGYSKRPLSQVTYSNKQKANLTDVLDNMGFTSDHSRAQKK